ncbi:MAG: transcriptional repressor LexA [Candidatus Pacebacteria bacterium]|nr:transcriptional repressor LexA [Candidatus Paceibacterota bacterium]
MTVTLYGKQKELLIFLTQYIQRNGFSPTLKEMGRDLGVNSPATVHEHLLTLEKKGLIRRRKGVMRGIELIYDDIEKMGNIEVPLLGFIAAGKPVEPYTDPEARITIPPSLTSGKRRTYVLQVKGDSMIEDGILDGDYVVIEEQETAKNGEIVVALLDNGFATLKRFFKEATRIKLAPANRKMRPIYAKNVAIQGRVRGIIRKYS